MEIHEALISLRLTILKEDSNYLLATFADESYPEACYMVINKATNTVIGWEGEFSFAQELWNNVQKGDVYACV